MVKFRGIEICIISQFDICKLPEFQSPYPAPQTDPFQGNETQSDGSLPPSCPMASCHVPIYPGSQIWFEYTVDGPHPPEVAYFFKLFINGKMITSWDCTAKHGFHGKMMYNLVSEGVDPRTGEPVVRRQALRFGDGLEERERGGMGEDWIQINVHRIEHKKRIRELQAGLGPVDVDSAKADGLRWTNSGLIEPGMRPKRYKYQLLDPVDMPYAAFRFYCRPYEYLEEQGIVRIRDCTSPCSSMSSIILPISGRASIHGDGGGDEGDENPDHTVSSPSIAGPPPQDSVIISPMKAGVVSPLREQRIQSTMKASESFTHIPLSDSDDSLSVRTKDSIEDLPSSVPRSPRSSRSSRQEADVGGRKDEHEPPPSPTRSPGSTRQRLKKKLTVQINGADFDIERKKRPLSPFTSGGVLRKASLPQTAPAAVTEFGPTVEDEVRAKLQKNKADESKEKTISKTTSAERGGKRLMGFLGRRTANEKTT